jgi:hypothetical protein
MAALFSPRCAEHGVRLPPENILLPPLPPRHCAHPSPTMARLLLLVRFALGFIVAGGIVVRQAVQSACIPFLSVC